MSIAPIGSVTDVPVAPPAPSIADFTIAGPSGLIVQSFAGALLAGAVAPPGALADDFVAPPTPAPVAPVDAAAAYRRIDIYA